jgi:hypothetical protein
MAKYQFASFEDSMGPLMLWQIVTNYDPKDDPHQQMLVDKSFNQLTQLSNAYSLQYLYSRENLPSVVCAPPAAPRTPDPMVTPTQIAQTGYLVTRQPAVLASMQR